MPDAVPHRLTDDCTDIFRLFISPIYCLQYTFCMSHLRSALLAALLLLTLAVPSPTCSWDYLIWIPRSQNADPLYRFIRNGKVGYIDQRGKIVVPPDIEWFGDNGGGEFHDGLLEVSASDGVYVDRTGKHAFHKKFSRGWDFSEGLAVAMQTDGEKWGYIDTRGEFAILPQFSSSPMDYVWPFEGGFAKIEVAGKFGYVDHSGNFTISPRFLDGDSFHDGYARVILEGPCAKMERGPCSSPQVVPADADKHTPLSSCKYSFVDTSGRIISDLRFDSAGSFSEGLAPVQISGLWGYIDTSGSLVIPARFEKAESFSDGLGLVISNGMVGYIDRTGAYAIQPQFKYAESFADGLAVIGDQDSGYWYINKSGIQAFPQKFLIASSYFKGLAHVKLQETSDANDVRTETFAYIDTAGKQIFKYSYKID